MTLELTGPEEEVHQDLPRVSLLVCMRNEARYIERCLTSLFAQDYPVDKLEIWVMDGQSTDGSWQIVERLLKGRPNCYLVNNPGVSQARGWNLGIENSTGDIVGIVSAHSELAQDYVSQAVETLLRTGADMVGGPMRAVGTGKVGQTISLATSSPFGVGGGRFHYTQREEEVDTVYMGVCWKKMYHQIGGFDVTMVCNEDDELSYRLLEHGGRIVCNPAIRSHYFNRATLSTLWKQYFKYGRWKPLVMQRHLRQTRLSHLVPSTFVVTLLLSALAAPFSAIGRLIFFTIAGSYAVSNLAASVWAARTSGWHHLYLLPFVFTAMHVSYGLGSLIGLFRLMFTTDIRRRPVTSTAAQ